MKKKNFRSLAALALSTAVVMSLGACSNNESSSGSADDNSSDTVDYSEYYTDVEVGDVVYSDDNCSVTIKSLETNDKGGSTLTLSLVSTYDTSVSIYVSSYDTDKYDTFVEKCITGNGGSVSPAENCETSWIYTSDDDAEAEVSYDFSDEYDYFNVSVDKYNEMYTDEQVNSDDFVYGDIDEILYDKVIRFSTAE